MIHRLCKRPFDTPSAATQSVVESRVINSKLFSPRGNTQASPTERYEFSSPRVSKLLLHRRPTAIRRPAFEFALLAFATGVIPIVINAINRVFNSFARPHIDDPICEPSITSPPLAHVNASPAVVRKRNRVRLGASCDHPVPNLSQRVFRHPVRGIPLSGHVTNETTARFSISNFHPSRLHGDKPSAIAKAMALGFVGRGAFNGHANHDQPFKPVTDHVVNTVESWALKWKAVGRFIHNVSMTEFSEGRPLATLAVFAFSLCPNAATMQ